MASAINKLSLKDVVKRPHPLLSRGKVELAAGDLVTIAAEAPRCPSPQEAQRIHYRFRRDDTPLFGIELLRYARHAKP